MSSLNDNKISQLTTKDIDLRGRKVVNAGPATQSTDYVTKAQLDQAIADLKKELGK